MLQMGKEIPCISLSLAKTLYVPLCWIMFFDGLQLQPSFVPLLLFFSFCNVGSVVKSAFTRYCDVVSWYVAILDVTYQCASLLLFSWFEFKIKQAVLSVSVCQSCLLLYLFSAHTASNVASRQCSVNNSDGFSISTLYYSDVPTHIRTTLDMYSAVLVKIPEVQRADLCTCDWQQKEIYLNKYLLWIYY